MACRMTELVLDCRDAKRLASFWSEVLGYRITDEDETGVSIGPPEGTPSPIELLFLYSDEPKNGKLRLHIDVNATDRGQSEELERLLALGATPIDIGQGGDQSWHVLADPEGNEFCLLRTTVRP